MSHAHQPPQTSKLIVMSNWERFMLRVEPLLINIL